jgi:hypothetical protein
MSPRRGERAAPPPVGEEYDLRFASNQAAEGWEQLGRQAGGNLRRAFDAIRPAVPAGFGSQRDSFGEGALTYRISHYLDRSDVHPPPDNLFHLLGQCEEREEPALSRREVHEQVDV